MGPKFGKHAEFAAGSDGKTLCRPAEANCCNRQPIYLAGLGHAYAVSGKRDEALNTIDKLNQLSRQQFVAARGVAEIYMGLDDKDQAFIWLEKTFEQRNGWLIHVKENQRYDSLRTDPRYADLVRRMKLNLRPKT